MDCAISVLEFLIDLLRMLGEPWSFDLMYSIAFRVANGWIHQLAVNISKAAGRAKDWDNKTIKEAEEDIEDEWAEIVEHSFFFDGVNFGFGVEFRIVFKAGSLYKEGFNASALKKI